MGDDASSDEAPSRLINRELSWLAFNDRVLSLARDGSVPLLSRLQFCGIWARNLDEYYQVRVAGLMSELADGGAQAADGMSSAEQLEGIGRRVRKSRKRATKIFGELVEELHTEGIVLCGWDDLDDTEKKSLTKHFDRHIFPVLSPLAVDPGHPFPYISNLSTSLAVLLANPVDGMRAFARVKVPLDALDRYVEVPKSDKKVRLEDVIRANIGSLFYGMNVLEVSAFRVTRSADLVIDDSDVDDLMSALKTELRRRRFGAIVRLEIEPEMSSNVLGVLLEELDATPDVVIKVEGPLDLDSATQIESPRVELSFPRWEPHIPPGLGDRDDAPAEFFAVLRQRDVLVHHPYDSFDDTVLEFLRQAAHDPNVLAIKATLYRTSGDGRTIEALTRAAESGKQVVVVVELKARFDEEANIEWAGRLERAGAHVAYGLLGLKVHSKIALVVRQESDGTLRRYCHVGTGNYNSKTARLYTDLGVLTSDEEIGADLSNLFNSLTGYGLVPSFNKIVVAPHLMRTRLRELIEHEATFGSEGHIVAKMNSLVDPELIEAMYAASQAGVKIDLIIRGICCLRPGVPGMSETVRVRSILGRFLEHSRVYYFAHGSRVGHEADDSDDALSGLAPEPDASEAANPGDDGPIYLIGSADLMPRNLDRRIEVLAPVEQPDLQERVQQILDVNLQDDATAWDLRPDGEWIREAEGTNGTHVTLQELTP